MMSNLHEIFIPVVAE